MAQPAILECSIVFDRRIEPQLAPMLERNCTSVDDVRETASHLRSLRPAWREIAFASQRGGIERRPSDKLENDGDMLRVDLRVKSREPLVLPGDARSADDAHAKLEALSSVLVGDILSCTTTVYPTTLDADPRLFPVDVWRRHWYCVCGGMSLAEVRRCPQCGRSREAGELLAPESQTARRSNIDREALG